MSRHINFFVFYSHKISEILLASGDLDKGFDLFVSGIIVHSGEEILQFDWDLSEVSHMEIKQMRMSCSTNLFSSSGCRERSPVARPMRKCSMFMMNMND